jgi:hypothetical protein
MSAAQAFLAQLPESSSEHSPLDQDVAEQQEQDNDEREGDVANLCLPRDSDALQVDALPDTLIRSLELGLGESKVPLLSVKSLLLVLLDSFEQLDDLVVLFHDASRSSAVSRR